MMQKRTIRVGEEQAEAMKVERRVPWARTKKGIHVFCHFLPYAQPRISRVAK